MGERATQGAPVTNLGIADLTGHMTQQRCLGGQQFAGLDRPMRGHCADGDMVAAVVDVAEVADPTDVDHDTGCGEPEPHQRDEAVATSQQLRVVAVLGQRSNRSVGRIGHLVVECGRDHAWPPFASLMVRHTR